MCVVHVHHLPFDEGHFCFFPFDHQRLYPGALAGQKGSDVALHQAHFLQIPSNEDGRESKHRAFRASDEEIRDAYRRGPSLPPPSQFGPKRLRVLEIFQKAQLQFG